MAGKGLEAIDAQATGESINRRPRSAPLNEEGTSGFHRRPRLYDVLPKKRGAKTIPNTEYGLPFTRKQKFEIDNFLDILKKP